MTCNSLPLTAELIEKDQNTLIEQLLYCIMAIYSITRIVGKPYIKQFTLKILLKGF